MVVALDEAPQLLLRLAGVELGVVLHRLGEPVVAGHRGAVFQHIQDEALLDGLLHRVAVEGEVPDRAVGLRVGPAEDLQRLVLRGGSEREVAGVRQQPARLDRAVDAVLGGLVLALLAGRPQRGRHGRRRAPTLAGMGLVDDDGEAPRPLLVADLVEDEGKLLDCRDDDLLAGLDEPPQVAGTVGVPHHRRADLSVLPDGVAYLPVEENPVGHHDDGVEDRGAVLRERDQLVGNPRYRVALATARGVLDEVAPARPVRRGVGQQPAHHVELVVTGPNLRPLLPACLLVLHLDYLGVVLKEVRQALAGKHLTPQVVGLDAAGVRRVAGAVVPAPVEREEPRCLSLEVGAEAHLALVHREVGHAAAQLEQLLARVAVLPVLPDRVLDRLLGQAVLQLEGEDRQAVDEEPDVERALRMVAAVIFDSLLARKSIWPSLDRVTREYSASPACSMRKRGSRMSFLPPMRSRSVFQLLP